MLRRALLLVLFASFLSVGKADAQVYVLPEYSGPEVTSGFPLPGVYLGSFVTGPVSSAFVFGTFGNTAHPWSTAGFDLFLDNVDTITSIPE